MSLSSDALVAASVPDDGYFIDVALATITDFVYVFDRQGRFRFVNKPLLDLWGLTLSEAVGKDFFDLKYPDDLAQKLQDQISEVIRTKKKVVDETPYTSPSGVDGFYEYIFTPVFDENGEVQAVAGSTRDVTERKNLEQERNQHVIKFRHERNKLEDLLEHSPALAASLQGPDHVFEFANKAYRDLVGNRELIGLSAREVFPEFEGVGFIDLLNDVYKTGTPYSASTVPVELVQDGITVQIYVDFVYQPIVEADGSISGVFVNGAEVTREVTSRKTLEEMNAELERRVDERTTNLEAAHKEMEGFTYSISHDLRTPLRAIVSTASMLAEDFPSNLPPDARLLLSRQKAAANRMADLIDDLLRLSRLGRQGLIPIEIDLSKMATQILVDHKVEDFQVTENLCVEADPILLRVALENLIGNAQKFTKPNTPPKIRVGQKDGAFFIQDEGVGFDMRYVDKIFIPFERLVLEHEFPGTGIGLANVKRIIEKHGGKIWAESALGVGSTFYFTLGK